MAHHDRGFFNYEAECLTKDRQGTLKCKYTLAGCSKRQWPDCAVAPPRKADTTNISLVLEVVVVVALIVFIATLGLMISQVWAWFNPVGGH